MLRIADIMNCCSDVDNVSAVFSVNEVRKLKIIIMTECCFKATVDSKMIESVTSDFNCSQYFFMIVLNALMTFLRMILLMI